MSARHLLAASALVATLALPAAARAEGDDYEGPLGTRRSMALSLGLGGLSNEVLADETGQGGYDLEGSANIFRLRGGGYLDATHDGRQIGIEGTLGIGWIDRASFIRTDASGNVMGAEPAWGRLFLDFDVTMLVDIVRMPPNRWLPPSRLSWLGGWGLSTDFAYFFLGGRLTGRLGPLEGELQYQRRFGESYSAPNQREERFHLNVYWKQLGLGVEYWHGYSEDELGHAATDRVFKGGYTMTALNLMWVPR